MFALLTIARPEPRAAFSNRLRQWEKQALTMRRPGNYPAVVLPAPHHQWLLATSRETRHRAPTRPRFAPESPGRTWQSACSPKNSERSRGWPTCWRRQNNWRRTRQQTWYPPPPCLTPPHTFFETHRAQTIPRRPAPLLSLDRQATVPFARRPP